MLDVPRTAWVRSEIGNLTGVASVGSELLYCSVGLENLNMELIVVQRSRPLSRFLLSKSAVKLPVAGGTIMYCRAKLDLGAQAIGRSVNPKTDNCGDLYAYTAIITWQHVCVFSKVEVSEVKL